MISRKIILFTCIVSFFSFTQAIGQQKAYNGNPDTSFATARNLAFNQQRKQAQDTLVHILTKYPNYHDIRLFLASTYSWDGKYKKAKTEYDYVLENDKTNKQAWLGCIQNELWADTPFIALEISEKALIVYPNDTEILYLKAIAQEKTNNPFDALTTIKSVLEKNPEDQKAKEYKNSLNQKLSLNNIGITTSVDIYSSYFDPMQYYSLKYGRQSRYGSLIARVNFNRRFNENGMQYELDLYPKISKGLYSYLSTGFSNSFLFPKVKFGAELFKSLPKGLEASLGYRMLKYDSTTNIYTASLGWYTGNNYLSFRSYITPSDTGTSLSGALTFRRYRIDADHYFSAALGMGYSPEINQLNYGTVEQRKINLKSQKLNLGYYFTSPNKLNAFGTQLGVTHQEISFDTGNYFWIYFVAFSWELRFK